MILSLFWLLGLSLSHAITFHPSFAPTFAVGNVSNAEYNALYDLYESTDGLNWNWEENSTNSVPWIFSNSSSPCANPPWQGVDCTCNYLTNLCTVTGLNLSRLGLLGTLPDSLCNLTNLIDLSLDDNTLFGTIPQYHSWSLQLSSVNLAFNLLAGTIPSWMWSLANIVSMYLGHNYLNSSLPDGCFENMSSLQTFILDMNYISGTIPSSLYSSLSSALHVLNLNNNFMTGTISSNISQLKNLLVFSLYNNMFSRSIPATLSELRSLVDLDLSLNYHFTGPLPELTARTLLYINLDENRLSGSIPDSYFTQCSNLMLLELFANLLNGSLPATIGQAQKLQLFDASFNNISGTLPNEFYQLNKLRLLVLDRNQLKGSLAPGIGNMSSLHTLALSDNHFTGTIPAEIGLIQPLRSLSLLYNDLTGSIPVNISQLTNLSTLDLSRNNLNGTIPTAIYGSLINLVAIHLFSNQLTGSIHSNISQLVLLESLDFGMNLLTNSFPNEIGELEKMVFIQLSDNFLTGSLPASIGRLSNLRFLAMGNNSLSQTLPASLKYLTNLQVFYLPFNRFNGSVGDILNGFPNLLYLDIGNNMFTGFAPSNPAWQTLFSYIVYSNQFEGKIPFGSKQTNLLVYADFGSNHFFSTIPLWLSKGILKYFYADNNPNIIGPIPQLPRTLLELWLEGNSLSHSIPDDIGRAKDLTILRLFNNHLTGTLPASLLNLTNLQQLYIANNSFSGDVNGLYDPSVQLQLIDVDISYNFFTSTIPVHLFNSTSLQVFAASGNCFSGSLSYHMCMATSLQTLALDSLSSALICQVQILPAIQTLTSFVLRKPLKGHIPRCLFELPQLRNLHLSGNSFIGTLYDDLVISSTMVNLSIASNQLTGTVPSVIQNKEWQNLDISFNRFSGTLSASTPPMLNNGTFYAQRNRLSGTVPAALLDANSIAVLEGNLFDCNTLQTNLPRNDPKRSSYICGSHTVNRSLMVWMVSFPVFIVICWAVYYSKICSWSNTASFLTRITDFYRQCRWWWYYGRTDGVSVLSSIKRIHRLFHIITFVCVVIFLPVYGVLTVYSGSYSYEYIWGASCLLVGGVNAAVVLMIFFCAVMTLTWLYLMRISKPVTPISTNTVAANDDNSDTVNNKNNTVAGVISEVLYFAGFSSVNLVVMLLIDILYVLAVEQVGSTSLVFAEAGLAFFKVAWNELILIRWFTDFKQFYYKYYSFVDDVSDKQINSKNNIVMQSISIVLNTVVIPTIAIAFASSNCFYGVLKPPQTEPSGFEVDVCQDLLVVGRKSYCLSYGKDYHTLNYQAPFLYSYQCSSFIIINYTAVYVYVIIIVTLFVPMMKIVFYWLSYDQQAKEGNTQPDRSNNYSFTINLKQLLWKFTPRNLKPLQPTPISVDQVLFDKRNIVIRLYQYLVIMLTFGVCFPSLAFAMCFAVYIVVRYEEIVIGRLLLLADTTSTPDASKTAPFAWYRERILAENNEAESYLQNPILLWLVLSSAALIYAYLVFDTIASTNGVENAIGPAIFIGFFPSLLFALWACNQRFASAAIFTTKGRRRTSFGDSVEEERVTEMEDMFRLSLTSPGSIMMDNVNPLFRTSSSSLQQKHNQQNTYEKEDEKKDLNSNV